MHDVVYHLVSAPDDIHKQLPDMGNQNSCQPG